MKKTQLNKIHKKLGAKMSKFPDYGWEIKNNVLTVLSSNGKESENGGDIVTNKKFKNFELELDFKISKYTFN